MEDIPPSLPDTNSTLGKRWLLKVTNAYHKLFVGGTAERFNLPTSSCLCFFLGFFLKANKHGVFKSHACPSLHHSESLFEGGNNGVL